MTIAAIDYGKRRLGLAAADPSGTIVYPAGVIERTLLKRDLATLGTRLRELEATRVIVGLPLNMDGSAGPAARAAERFAQHLREATGLPVELYDERLSTFEADERLKGASKSRHRDRIVDAVAAVVILESWLQKRNVDGE
jgi:putative Holliday junction resolvase